MTTQSRSKWLKEFKWMWESNHHNDNKTELVKASDVEMLIDLAERPKDIDGFINDDTIGIFWGVEDVFEICPYITSKVDARKVLSQTVRYHDATIGVDWDILESHGRDLFPELAKNYVDPEDKNNVE
jgi:fructose-1,6-bisphosphatase